MSIKDFLFKKKNEYVEEEFCPKCKATLKLQKGYTNELPYWICRGCHEMLINPNVDDDSCIVWVCDGCGEMLNIQDGFKDDCGEWKCSECRFINKIDASEIYDSEDEFQSDLHNPYRGLSDEELLEIQSFEEIDNIGNKTNVFLVRNFDDEKLYVKKILKDYDLSIYQYLMENPVGHIPKIIGIYEGANNLIVIEEYIEGKTLAKILESGPIDKYKAIDIIIQICKTLSKLHGLSNPIIHRDIKPSNVIVTGSDDVYVIDINVAKWYDEEQNEDTKLLGTPDYAAPEQFGYSLKASSEKTDIYALGVLLNVMLTGERPKDARPDGNVWNVIERCICLNPEDRYTANELIDALTEVE